MWPTDLRFNVNKSLQFRGRKTPFFLLKHLKSGFVDVDLKLWIQKLRNCDLSRTARELVNDVSESREVRRCHELCRVLTLSASTAARLPICSPPVPLWRGTRASLRHVCPAWWPAYNWAILLGALTTSRHLSRRVTGVNSQVTPRRRRFCWQVAYKAAQ